MARATAFRVFVAIALAGAAVSAPLLAVGVSAGPFALLTLGLVIAFAMLSAWYVCADADRDLAALIACVKAEGEARTPPAAGGLAIAVDAFRKMLARALEDRRKARASAELTEKYEAEFLTTLSHELRTPLNSVLGFSQVLLDEIDGPLNAAQRESVRAVLSSGEHLRGLVDDVLDLAALTANRITLKKQRVEMAPIIDEIVRLLESQRADGVVLGHVIAADVPPVDGDPKRLRQIVWNLAGNAVKFTRKGRVMIAARAAGDRVRLTVTDTGRGIAAHELEAIFEEFVQADEHRRVHGTGLGLAICKRLTDLHGGEIRVTSEVGKGSEFEVLLPVWKAPT